jgi:alpha-glucosidase
MEAAGRLVKLLLNHAFPQELQQSLEAVLKFVDNSMARLQWSYAILAFSSLVTGQSSTSGAADGLTTAGPTTTESVGTATVNGTPTTYSVAFTVPAEADIGPNLLPNVEDQDAKQAQALCPGYTASNVKRSEHGFSASLTLAGDPCNVYGTDIEDLILTVQFQSARKCIVGPKINLEARTEILSNAIDRMRINIEPAYIDDSNSSYYVLPSELVYAPKIGHHSQEIDLEFSWSNDPTFSFVVVRKSTGDVLFDTRGSVLVYENQFIEFVSQLPEKYNLYGMGERIHGLRLGNNFTATFYAADAGDPIDGNIYGNHPVYLDTRYYEIDESSGERTIVTDQDVSADGNYESYTHGVYMRNAHGMEALMLPTNLTWRTIGGSIDLYIFDGPTPNDVIRQYQGGAVGLPVMQQYWTFGFHQCRWGYKNWSMTEDVVNTYRAFDIPLESIWLDIDYMFQYRDFTNDQNTFPYDEGQEFIARLHANGQHHIPIVDSAIYIPNPNNASDNYSVYTDGHERGVFMLNPDGSEYIGAVWPGYTVFPDWRAEDAVSWWSDSLKAHHDKVPWSGIWIDMSEVSSFCIGSCGSGNLSLNPVHPPFKLPGEPGAKIYTYPEGFENTNKSEAATASSLDASQASANAAATPPSSQTTPYFVPTVTPGVRSLENPPYVIDNINGALGVHAVSPNATHVDGVLEYDVHNLFGYQILNATYQGLLEVFPGKRPFIIGRSTFAGSGECFPKESVA